MRQATPPAEPDTERLALVAEGDRDARNRLLDRHRRRLENLVHLHIDPRLAARGGPSAVVQESLAEAGRRLPDHLRGRSMQSWALDLPDNKEGLRCWRAWSIITLTTGGPST